MMYDVIPEDIISTRYSSKVYFVKLSLKQDTDVSITSRQGLITKYFTLLTDRRLRFLKKRTNYQGHLPEGVQLGIYQGHLPEWGTIGYFYVTKATPMKGYNRVYTKVASLKGYNRVYIYIYVWIKGHNTVYMYR